MLIIFLVTLLVDLASGSHIWTGLLVLIFCFLFSFIGVYGARASSIGVNALLVMVLNIDRPHTPLDSLITAAYVLAGGMWYTVLSLLLYSFRPYRLVQQAIGDCIQATAGYLRVKAAFYARDTDYDEDYRQLVESQVDNHTKQDLVRELLFKSRNIVQESTHVGRVLMMIFLDIIDFFERIMTSQQDYRMLHRAFDGTELMQDCRRLILQLAAELDEIGIAIMSGKPSAESGDLAARIREVRGQLAQYRDRHGAVENADAFSSMDDILDSIEDLALRLHTLHGYTTYDRRLSRNVTAEVDVGEFVAHTEVDRKLIVDNLNFSSDIFRHAVRVSIATLAGYIISGFLPFGHGYWILLTIIVIMKPVYSLTKQRNVQRLLGTLGGAFVGLLILYFIKDTTVLFLLMFGFMIMTYVFLRTNYLIAVIMTTPYVLLLFHLLYPTDFRTILADRVIDTVIGSGISFVASLLIIPRWEHERISDFMSAALEANIAYFRDVAGSFLGRPATVHQYKLSRKNAFVALANLSDALSRMLSEPRRQQKSITEMHQFVVSNHMLTSHIATLAYYMDPYAAQYADKAYEPVVEDIVFRLERSVDVLEDKNTAMPRPPAKELLLALNQKAQASKDFKPVVDQFNFISKVTADLAKISPALALSYGRREAPSPSPPAPTS
ncbi:MAG TPA: FUSC family membrane protein [Puia sp.]|uniref:FUSC family protein n=1 Tax=Puia sp. TaxID=2045100 RepID=UPI002BD1E31C|nr:FUSC family membrane protein [Puia sp.]HVU98869.1 FUSC family membrane protein [Puia sp.]